MTKLPESLDAFQPPHEREWIAQHGQAWIAAAAQVLDEFAPMVAWINDVKRLRDGAAPRFVVDRLAPQLSRDFKLFPRVKRAVRRIAREERRPPEAVKRDALVRGLMLAAQELAAEPGILWADYWARLPRAAHRHAQRDLLEQAKSLDPEEVPETDTAAWTPMDAETLDTALIRLGLTPGQEQLVRLIAGEGLTLQQARAVMKQSPGALADMLYRILKSTKDIRGLSDDSTPKKA